MTLHLLQIFLTEALTFMMTPPPCPLFPPVHDPAPSQIIGGELNGNLITRENLNEMHSHFSGNVRENTVPVVQFNPEHGVGQGLHHRSFHRNDIFFGHEILFLLQAYGRTLQKNPHPEILRSLFEGYRALPSPFFMNPS
jgi:hypothetical protein